MPRNYPHINDTRFPDLDNVDAYKYQNNFDYAKYDKTQMTIHVCSVPWDVGLIHVGNAQIGGLGNVVKFEDKDARDAWFENLDDFTWQTKYRDYHTSGYIEVPLPYEVCCLYNYVWVEYDLLPVDYAEGGKDKFFFFIRACEALAPSTCKVEILRDTWQTYIYDIDVAYMMLEQGHAPMALTDASRYLQNPIENCAYLLADDANFGTSYVSRRAGEAILNDENMLACFVTSSNLSEIFGEFADGTAWTPNGRKMQDGQLALYAYCLEPANLATFLNSAETEHPQFMQTIKAVFFVKADFVNVTAYITFANTRLGILAQKTELLDVVSLNKAMFGYGEDYAELAKLYTYPYAYLEISDEGGNVDTVRIEETSGEISLSVTTSLAYPWLSLDTRLEGIGTGRANITFSNVTQHSFYTEGDWFNHIRKWDIPTFAVNVSAEIINYYDTFFDRQQAYLEADTAHDNAIRSATATRDNAKASASTSETNSVASANTAKSNADDMADTVQGNAERTALAAHDNSVDSANTDAGNAVRSATAARDNSKAIAATAKTNADANASTANSNARRSASNAHTVFGYQRQIASEECDLMTSTEDWGVHPALGYPGYIGAQAWHSITKISDDWDADWILENALLTLNIDQTAATSTLNAVAGAAGGTISGAVGGLVAGPGGAAVGTVAGLAGSAVSLAQASAAIPMAAGFSAQMGQEAIDAGDAKTDNAVVYTRDAAWATRKLENDKYNIENNYGYQAANATRQCEYDNADDTKDTANDNAQRNKTTDDSNADRTYNAATANAGDSQTTAIANAGRTYNAAIDNADDTNTTTKDNATATEATAVANAGRDRATAHANADRSFNAAKDNADDTRDTAYEAVQNSMRQAGLKAPTQFGEWANGDTSTTRPMGVFCNVVTQTKDAIEQAGDQFLRFGYRVNRAWRFEGFNVMPRFTYWKAADIWVKGNNVPDAYMDEIRFFLLGGVCVWRNPEDIGRISIYENV